MKNRTPAQKPTSPSAKKSKNASTRRASRRQSSGLEYQTLEQRLPLDASFEFAGGVLTISNFTGGTDLTVDVGAEVTARIDGNNNFLGEPGAFEFPEMMVDADGNVDLGDILIATGVTELIINSTGFGAAAAEITVNFENGETLDALTVDTPGDISINGNGNEFDLLTTTLSSNGNVTQSDNRPAFVSTSMLFGAVVLDVGGDASFDSLTADTIGGQVFGNLTTITADGVDAAGYPLPGNIFLNDQLGMDFNNDGEIDALRVRGDASITVEDGAIIQSTGASVIIDGTLTLSTASAGNAPVILNGSDFNDFNLVIFGDDANVTNSEVNIFDVNDFEVMFVRLFPNIPGLSGNLHLAAGRGGLTGSLTISGDISPGTAIFQARTGFTQTSGLVETDTLLLGGTNLSEGGGDFIFNGSLEGNVNDDDLQVFDFSARVRGNLDFSTSSEITLVSGEPIVYPDARANELFEDSWADGNARINANRTIFDASFETNKFVLTVESDVIQSVDTSLITDQFYIVGKEIDLRNDTNDTNQLSARGLGDESFIRYSDVGTFRIASLDGSIDIINSFTGATENGSSNINDPAVLNGLFTDRVPEITIGVQSFIEINTGLGGPVDNPRVGAPPVELDNIEKFEVIRDAGFAQFATDEYGLDGRGVFFVEFIYDGFSPFEFVAQSNQFDAELALYDEVGSLVFVSDDPSLGLNSTISNEDIDGGLPAGRYYLASAAFSATFGDDFDVQTEFDDGVPAFPRGELLITLESPAEDPDADTPELLLARLQSFFAPEVRRSFFQNDDAPIDTEKLFVSVVEDGSINFLSPQNRIDDICIFETDDFVLHSSSTINIDTLNANGNVLLTAPGAITFNDVTAQGNVEIETPARVLGQNLNAVGDFSVSGDVVNLEDVTTGGDVAITATSAAVLTDFDVVGGIAVASSTNDIVVDGIRAQGDVSLAAADDVRLAAPNGINRLEATNLILFADNINNDNINGVFLYTDVDSIITNIGSGGEIFINEQSEVDLELTTTSGPITLQANGSITGNASVALPGNDITLLARGDDSDVSVDLVSVLGSNDNVRLFAGDDITANVQGGNLQAIALNAVADQNVSVQLNTTVRTLNVSAGLISDTDPNRGDIVVSESNPLILTRAVAANGQILVSANGNISTGNVQSNGISTGNAIEIRANGFGSDLSTSRIVVRDGTGGVLLSADDDIVDGNVNDRLAVVADRVTYEARNNQIDSFDGVIGHSYADQITVTITGSSEAGAFLFNTGNTTVADTSIANGQFSLTNRSGAVRIDDISILSQQISNRVFVRTNGFGGDVLVGDIDAGSNGIVTIDSADDVFDTDLLDDLFISGELLNVTARNNRDDSFDGIILNVDVDELSDIVFNDAESFIRREA